MKRYLVTGDGKPDKIAERNKEVDEGLRKAGFDVCGEGKVIFLGHHEEGGYCMIVECEGPPKDFLADFLTIADAEIKPIALCPKDCTKHPQPCLVQPLRDYDPTMTEKEYPIKYRTTYIQMGVEDLDRAKKFYEDVFGLEVSWYMSPEVGWCALYLPGKGARLGLNAGGPKGFLIFDVEDLEEAKGYLEGKGLETTEVTDVPEMISYFNIKDSEGNKVQIVSDPRVTSQ